VSARKIFAAGYTDIVSVIPPGAKLSPNSKIKPDQLGKVPGKLGPYGWSGYSFTTEPASAELAARIDETGANVGLLGDRFPALDIDVKSAALRDVVLRFAFERLGRTAPIRLSREPRRLLVFRCDVPFSKLQLFVTHKDDTHLIEILGAGRQYLVHGKHPAGVDYRWEGSPLWHLRPESLPLLDREKALTFLQELSAFLTSKGLTCKIEGDGVVREEKPAPVQTELLAPSIDELREMVARIPNDADSAPGWDAYIEYGYAIKAAAGPQEAEGLEIYQEWAERCTRVQGDADDAADQWSRLHPPFRVGWNWLVEQAELFGGYVSAQYEFQPDPDAPPPEKPKRRELDFSEEWVIAQILPKVKRRLIYVPGANANEGTWHAWTGNCWRKDAALKHEAVVRALLNKLAMSLHDKGIAAAAQCDTKAAKKEASGAYLTAAKRLQSEVGIRSIIRLLRQPCAYPADVQIFDLDPMVINTPGGIVDLRTGGVTEVTPEHMLSRLTTVAPAPGEAPIWQRFMHDLAGGDSELIRFIQKMVGYSLTGDINEKALWFVWGSDSDTGKSTFIRALSLLFGDYADTVDIDAFVGARDRIPADLARLPGVRLVTAAEPAAGQAWDEARIKSITGGDTISARFLYGQPFTFRPQFKILIVGNHEPEIKNVDDAMLRRIHIVPFNIKVPREKQVPDLAQKMIEREGPQILQWLIDGALLWQQEKLAPPKAVQAKTSEYADAEDIFGQWIAEECELDVEAVTSRYELYQAWSGWCRSRGEIPGTLKQLKGKFQTRRTLKLQETKTGKSRLQGYRGIRLRPATEDGTEFQPQ
jgi:P4 family phage/plasmid primase-like protien